VQELEETDKVSSTEREEVYDDYHYRPKESYVQPEEEDSTVDPNHVLRMCSRRHYPQLTSVVASGKTESHTLHDATDIVPVATCAMHRSYAPHNSTQGICTIEEDLPYWHGFFAAPKPRHSSEPLEPIQSYGTCTNNHQALCCFLCYEG
jgi:hypothetical protein